VGTGETEFVAVADGDELVVIQGPQLGWHVYGSIRCTGITATESLDPRDTDQPQIRLVLVDEDGVFGGYELLPRPMTRTDEGWDLIGDLIIVWTPTYAEATNRSAILELVLTDATGATYESRKSVKLVANPDQEPIDTDAPDTATLIVRPLR
jgi:hypothetical protein